MENNTNTLTKQEQFLSDKLRAINISKDTNIDVDAIDKRYLEILDQSENFFASYTDRKHFAVYCYNIYADLMNQGMDPIEWFEELKNNETKMLTKDAFSDKQYNPGC